MVSWVVSHASNVGDGFLVPHRDRSWCRECPRGERAACFVAVVAPSASVTC